MIKNKCLTSIKMNEGKVAGPDGVQGYRRMKLLGYHKGKAQAA